MIISANAKIIFVLLKYLIPLSRPVCADNMKRTVTIAIITNCVVNEFGIDVK